MGDSGKASGEAITGRSKQGRVSRAQKRRLAAFVLTFLALLAVGAVLYPYFSIAFDSELKGFMALTATVCGGLLDIFFDDVYATGRLMSFHGFSVEIIEECTGIFEMLIFLAALISYPASWRAKSIGILLGIPTLYLFNVVRIVFLAVVGAHYAGLFDFMHLYFWQSTLILMITTVWVIWILLVVSREKKSAAIFS